MTNFFEAEHDQPELATKPNQPTGQGQSVNMEGWNTINALRMDTLNEAIVAQGTTPKTKFTHTNKFSGSISGTWGSWQVFADADANGGVVRMRCPVKSGSALDITGATHNLDGAIAYLTVRLKAVPTPTVNVVDNTAIAGTGTISSLKIEKTGTASKPPVVVNNMTPVIIKNQFKPTFQAWFDAHIHEFDALFHTAILNAKVDVAKDGNFQWVKPLFHSYATSTNQNGVGMFGALCQCDKGPYGKLAEQIPPGLLDDMPDNVNSVFAISGEKFTEQFLKAGAKQCIPNSKLSDFEIFGDGLSVRNVAELDWIEMDFHGKKVKPKIPRHGLTMKVSGNQLQVEYSGLTWDHKLILGLMGSDVFHLSFSQVVYLDLKWNSKGQPVFVTSNTPPGSPKTAQQIPRIYAPHITVVPDKTAIEVQHIMSIVMMVGAVLGAVGGAIKVIKVFANGTRVIVDGASAVAEMINEGDSIFQLAIDADSINSAITSVEVAAGNTEGLAVATGSATSISAKYLTFFTRFCMLGGLTGLAGIGLVDWQKSLINKDNHLEPDSMPTLDHFIDNVVGTAHWPTLPTWKLKEVRLAESLLLYGNISK